MKAMLKVVRASLVDALRFDTTVTNIVTTTPRINVQTIPHPHVTASIEAPHPTTTSTTSTVEFSFNFITGQLQAFAPSTQRAD